MTPTVFAHPEIRPDARPDMLSSETTSRAAQGTMPAPWAGTVQNPVTIDPQATASLLERLVAGSRSAEDRMKRNWRKVAGDQVAERFCTPRG